MKKILFTLLVVTAISMKAEEVVMAQVEDECTTLDTVQKVDSDSCLPCNMKVVALTAGYVFKPHDALFRDVYGVGMGNVITIDLNYQLLQHFSIGGKLSYWLAAGRTTFVRRRAILQEIPVTAYVRAHKDVCHDIRLYASIGGGALWMHEKSYLGHTALWKGIGEAEVGLNYPWCPCVQLTTACRYLFPRQQLGINKATLGGVDLRAGIAITF